MLTAEHDVLIDMYFVPHKSEPYALILIPGISYSWAYSVQNDAGTLTHLVITRSQEVLFESVFVAALQHAVARDFAVIHG